MPDETTIILAKLVAAYFVVTGLGLLLSTKFYERMVRTSNEAHPILLNLSGAAHFLVGASMLMHHWRWSTPLETIISLVGVAAMMKGAALIVIPQLMVRVPRTGTRALRASGIFFIVVGGCVGYAGFVHGT